MKFIFETEPESSRPVLADVKDDQFFVDITNRLCQKVGYYAYNVITNTMGKPVAKRDSVDDPETYFIERVLPTVKKIEF